MVRKMVLVLVVALVVSLAYVPSVHAAPSTPENDTGTIILGVVGIAAIIWALSAMSAKGAEILAEKAEAEREATRVKRQEYIDAHPELDERIQTAILAGNVALGMTAEQVRLVWGEPHDINRSVGSWGVTEQWVYRWVGGDSTYIYLDNGSVRSFQE